MHFYIHGKYKYKKPSWQDHTWLVALLDNDLVSNILLKRIVAFIKFSESVNSFITFCRVKDEFSVLHVLLKCKKGIYFKVFLLDIPLPVSTCVVRHEQTGTITNNMIFTTIYVIRI